MAGLINSEASRFGFTSTLSITMVPDPMLRRLIQLRRMRLPFEPQGFVLTVTNGMQVNPARIRTRLQPVGRQLGLPWLSMQRSSTDTMIMFGRFRRLPYHGLS